MQSTLQFNRFFYISSICIYIKIKFSAYVLLLYIAKITKNSYETLDHRYSLDYNEVTVGGGVENASYFSNIGSGDTGIKRIS